MAMVKEALPKLPDAVVALQPGEIDNAPKLLRDYESAVGQPLRKLAQPVMLANTVEWPWSWSPEEAGIFLADWTSKILLVNATCRALAFTVSPDGRSLMYERFCNAELRDAIQKVEVMYDVPLGAVPPVPVGPHTIDLRRCPHVPGVRPTVFTVNHWHFFGVVKNISKELFDQLSYMHGVWYADKLRAFAGNDHEIRDLGEVRR